MAQTGRFFERSREMPPMPSVTEPRDEQAENTIRQMYADKHRVQELLIDLSDMQHERDGERSLRIAAEQREIKANERCQRLERANARLVSRCDAIIREVLTMQGELHADDLGIPTPPEPAGDPLEDSLRELTEVVRERFASFREPDHGTDLAPGAEVHMEPNQRAGA